MNEFDQAEISTAELSLENTQIGIFRNIPIEKSIIGSLLCDSRKWLDVDNLISEEDFTNQYHKSIFSAIQILINESKKSDENVMPGIGVDTILAILENQGNRFENDENYLEECRETPENPDHMPSYVRMLRTASLRRNIRTSGKLLQESAGQKADDLTQILNSTLKLMQPIQKFQIGRNEPSTMNELIFQVTDDFQQKKEIDLDEKPIELVTGLDDLDDKIGEFQPGQLCIIGARPGVGKTAFGLQIARKNLENDRGVLMFSLEMSKLEIMHRLLCSTSGIFLNNLKYVRLYKDLLKNSNSVKKLNSAIEKIKAWPFILDDTPSLTETELAIKVHRMKQSHPNLQLVIVDYVTLMKTAGRQENRNLEVAAISREMKLIAKQESVTIIVLSQLNRASLRDSDGIDLSSLRDSGALEQDADIVMLMENIKEYQNPADSNKTGIRIKLAKNRNGPIGEFQFVNDKRFFKIENHVITNEDLAVPR